MYRSAINQNKRQGCLLLDEYKVRQACGCELQFCQAVKDPASPMIRATESWEGLGPYTWCSRMLFDPETEKYRMYYTTFQERGNHYRWGFAESKDGLNWHKPNVFETEYEGQPVSYCVQTEGFDLCKPPRSVTYDPRPDCPAEERYKGIAFSYQGVNVFYSADGINWKGHPQNPVWDTASDIIHCMWDERLKKFVSYYKVWKLWAMEKDETAPAGFRKIEAYLTRFKTKERSDGLTEITGPFVTLHPESKAKMMLKTILVRSGALGNDDGGGGHLTGVWYTKRVICRAESDDFIHWEKEQEVMAADDLDRPDANIQIAQVFYMGGYYLAFLTMHDERGHFDQQLAFSVDGIKWKRPWRGNLIGHGAPGQFDHGMATQPVDPIITQTQMLIYYGGCEGGHVCHGHGTMSIGRAMLRRDGFAYWKAKHNETAVLETVALSYREDSLYLNVDAEGGWITAALLDENRKTIPGFEHENCILIIEDSISYPDCFIPVSWKGIASLPLGKGKKVHVQLRFKNASVYSVLL